MKTAPEPFFQRYKLHLAAAAGGVGGMVVASAVFLVTLGSGQAWDFFASLSKSSSATTATEIALHKKTEELITILEAISRWGSHTGDVTGTTGVPEHEECLKRCRMDFPGTDEQSRTLLLDCTKGCLLQYSVTMKEIQERFHGPAPKR